MIINLTQMLISRAALLLFLLGINGCGFKQQEQQREETINMSPLCHFNLDEELLSDGDSLRLLYASWDTNDERMGQEHYIQVIALKLASGDTVNVLTGFETKFSQEDGDRIFVYQKYDRDFQQIMAQQRADFLANKDKLTDPAGAQRFADELAENRENMYNYKHGPAVYIDGTMKEVFENNFPFTIGRLNRL